MTVLKCKMCGGDIELSENKTFGTCEYCGCTMTLPKINDDQKAAIYNRGNHFRRIGEYDKALAVYERIVSEDNTDAEAHWCCALSRFGIEYVEDPSTYEWFPTCHRLSFDSFLEDVDYLAALEYSDGITRRQYQKDALKIAEVQRGILAVSQKEEPFDVFICYKESDENNNRTIDSTLAQDIYYQLTDKGYKVFFSRITLEDKVGTEYEPYIFAALNSAKVMVVVGTKPEYLNAVWVKNEWSRFLQLMKKDRSKVIIPCYRDMDPYDLPEQLSVLQSYDMAKIGFIQDLLRGISKIVGKNQKETKPTVSVVQQAGPNVTALLDRGYLSLEDGDWNSARKFFDEALNMNARSGEAYLGLAMADINAKDRKEFGEYLKNNDIQNRNFDRAKRFADDSLSNQISEWEEAREKAELAEKLRIEEEKRAAEENKIKAIYNEAISIMDRAESSTDFLVSAKKFESILEHEDSFEKAKECREQAEIYKRKEEEARKKAIYDEATSIMARAKSPALFLEASKKFGFIKEYNDSAQKAKECREQARILDEAKKAEEERLRQEKEKKEQIITDLERRIKELDDSAVQGEGSEIKQRIKEKEDYLKTLGIFKKKEKEAVRKEIEELEEKLNHKRKKLVNELSPVIGIKGLDGKVGDTVLFGNSLSESGLKIEWIILAEKDGQKLLITKKDVGKRPYHDSKTSVTWETCSLRKWLNYDFLNTAFYYLEKTMIQETEVQAQQNPKYDTYPGRDTKDNIFLLSIKEAKEYFKTDKDRASGDWWWLRTPGNKSNFATLVSSDGSVLEYGINVNLGNSVIRPALWVRVK